jgi:hypothetical protein
MFSEEDDDGTQTKLEWETNAFRISFLEKHRFENRIGIAPVYLKSCSIFMFCSGSVDAFRPIVSRVGFVEDKVALQQVFFQILGPSPPNYPTSNSYSFVNKGWCNRPI